MHVVKGRRMCSHRQYVHDIVLLMHTSLFPKLKHTTLSFLVSNVTLASKIEIATVNKCNV